MTDTYIYYTYIIMPHYLPLLSIAGHDPSGGAGIAADLKTFSALGCYGMAVVTAITFQNTLGVTDSHPLSANEVEGQLRPILDDIPPQAIKIGMTCNAEIAQRLGEVLRPFAVVPIILDPVMVSSSGHPLMDEAGRTAVCKHLLPLCEMVTPNLHELALLGEGEAPVQQARSIIRRYGVRHVLVKGGHADGNPRDILVSATTEVPYDGIRIATRNNHGTGCTLSSAIAAYLAQGFTIYTGIRLAKSYITRALTTGANVETGRGHGPMNHFFEPAPLIIEE